MDQKALPLRFKRVSTFLRNTGLPVEVNRACAVTCNKALHEDVLNVLLRYSMLTRAVPRFEKFKGFFDLRDVHEVAKEITKKALAEIASDDDESNPTTSTRFFHHLSGIEVPVSAADGGECCGVAR